MGELDGGGKDRNLRVNVEGRRETGRTLTVCFLREKHVRYPTGREIEL